MTQPPNDPTSPPTDPKPTDPTPTDPKPTEPTPTAADQVADLQRRLKAAESGLDSERRSRSKYESEISRLKASQLTEAEKAVAAAREEGKVEALRAAGGRLAAAEFRAQAAARLGDLAGALDADLVDFGRFVDDAGEPDVKRIETMVAKLAEALPNGNGRPTAPTVPSGPRPDPGEQDWLRAAIAAKG